MLVSNFKSSYFLAPENPPQDTALGRHRVAGNHGLRFPERPSEASLLSKAAPSFPEPPWATSKGQASRAFGKQGQIWPRSLWVCPAERSGRAGTAPLAAPGGLGEMASRNPHRVTHTALPAGLPLGRALSSGPEIWRLILE